MYFEQHTETSPHAIAALRLLTLTGCRSAEILKLRWDEVDFERRCLHLVDSETGKRTVLLITAALEVLVDLERLDDNPHVIPGAKAGSDRASLQNVWPRICRHAGIQDARVHDLRHTSRRTASMVGRVAGDRKAAGALEDHNHAGMHTLMTI